MYAPSKKVLIIDDNEDILILFKITLEMDNHDVTTIGYLDFYKLSDPETYRDFDVVVFDWFLGETLATTCGQFLQICREVNPDADLVVVSAANNVPTNLCDAFIPKLDAVDRLRNWCAR